MHCDRCGHETKGLAACAGCHAVPAALWLLATSLLLWVAALTLDAVDRVVLYQQLAKVYEGLGTRPPAPAPLYFAVAGYVRYLALAWAVAAPLAIALRAHALDVTKWTRRYANSAALGFGWALVGLALCYYAASSFQKAL